MQSDLVRQRTFRHPDNGRKAVVYLDRHDHQFEVQFQALGIERDSEICETLAEAFEAAREFIDEPATNIEFIVHLMTRAESGPLMQAFVIEALARYAEEAKDLPDDEAGHVGFINPAAWRSCAAEVTSKLRARL